ncbi:MULTISPECIES: Ada metal-binding domain-containing protein [Burkholderia]|uniref:Ada metal-binding domain-containing protein n=1 Tax=Burkholderia TaxID=32008 RepID=UPI0009DFF96B|nr:MULTISPECIES: Ada metal-binding domain-containing protein [Burkholderia]
MITRSSKTYTLLGSDLRSYASPIPGTFGGHRSSRIYGRLDCRSALQAIARGGYVKNRVFFLDEQAAEAAGYRPCAVCLPEKYAAWKARTAAIALTTTKKGRHS